MAAIATILKIYFSLCPEPKGQLTPNLVGSIRMTCTIRLQLNKFQSKLNSVFISKHNREKEESKEIYKMLPLATKNIQKDENRNLGLTETLHMTAL